MKWCIWGNTSLGYMGYMGCHLQSNPIWAKCVWFSGEHFQEGWFNIHLWKDLTHGIFVGFVCAEHSLSWHISWYPRTSTLFGVCQESHTKIWSMVVLWLDARIGTTLLGLSSRLKAPREGDMGYVGYMGYSGYEGYMGYGMWGICGMAYGGYEGGDNS